MDAYAAVKAHCHDSHSIRIVTLVNQAADSQTAQDAHTRLQRACRRFLCVDTSMLGSLSFDSAVPDAAAKTRPFVVHAPDCAASQELAGVVSRLTAHIARRGESITRVVERGAASAVAVR
jgi:MinD-like ATPase involved in chromosome partitioning or flagellar assembly